MKSSRFRLIPAVLLIVISTFCSATSQIDSCSQIKGGVVGLNLSNWVSDPTTVWCSATPGDVVHQLEPRWRHLPELPAFGPRLSPKLFERWKSCEFEPRRAPNLGVLRDYHSQLVSHSNAPKSHSQDTNSVWFDAFVHREHSSNVWKGGATGSSCLLRLRLAPRVGTVGHFKFKYAGWLIGGKRYLSRVMKNQAL